MYLTAKFIHKLMLCLCNKTFKKTSCITGQLKNGISAARRTSCGV